MAEGSEHSPPASQASPLRKVRMVLWLLVLFAAGVGLFLWVNQPAGDGTASESETGSYADSIGGPFELTAPDGSTVTEATLAGEPYAIFFGFTRCPDVCPTSLARLAQLRERLGEDGDRFRIVFVSVDPGYDKPEDIGRYVDLFGTPIIGLTGTEEQIDRIARAYHVYHQKVPVEGGDYTIDHTAGIYLMDGNGRLQSMIDYHEDLETSLAKLKQLVA